MFATKGNLDQLIKAIQNFSQIQEVFEVVTKLKLNT
jgi:hypothetical protein